MSNENGRLLLDRLFGLLSASVALRLADDSTAPLKALHSGFAKVVKLDRKVSGFVKLHLVSVKLQDMLETGFGFRVFHAFTSTSVD